MPEPRITALILNTNRREDTLACLASLVIGTYKNLRIILLDNNSTDGTVEAVEERFPDVNVLKLKENRGYAGNNNVGIGAAINGGADWLFVLNEDTVVDSDCVARLAAAGESDPTIGIVGPTVYHHNEPNIIQSAGGIIGPYWESLHLNRDEPNLSHNLEPRPVDWISGCGIMVRRQVVEDVGAIDERYFYYWEETEWCIRARRAGWRILHVPAAKLWHKGVQRDYRPPASVTYYATRNRLLTLAKHRAPLTVWIGAGAQIVRTLTSWAIRPRWKCMTAHRHAMWRGVVDFLFRRWGGPVQL
ncbi:MAG: glycosyltransferase family 2 protein [Acidobacteriales bacterium]|nr:glycosyltransferase family 2 protein [Terriglobales bacterium]